MKRKKYNDFVPDLAARHCPAHVSAQIKRKRPCNGASHFCLQRGKPNAKRRTFVLAQAKRYGIPCPPCDKPFPYDSCKKNSSGFFGIFGSSKASNDVSSAQSSTELSTSSSESSDSSSKKTIKSLQEVLVRERKNAKTKKPVKLSRAIHHNRNSGWNVSIPEPTAKRLLRVMNSFPLRSFPTKSDKNGNILYYYQNQSLAYANALRPLKDQKDIEILHLPSTPGLGSDLKKIAIPWDSFVDTKFIIEMICPWTQFGVMPHCVYCLENEHVIPTRRWDRKAGIMHTNVDGTFRVVTARLYKCTKCKKQKKGKSVSSNTSKEPQEFNCREIIHLLPFMCQLEYDLEHKSSQSLVDKEISHLLSFFIPRGNTLNDVQHFLASSRENRNTNLIAAFLSSIPEKDKDDRKWNSRTLRSLSFQ